MNLTDEARAFCFKSEVTTWEVTHEESHQLMADFAAEQLRLQRERIAQELEDIHECDKYLGSRCSTCSYIQQLQERK